MLAAFCPHCSHDPVPWLVLFGRCSLQWADQLLQSTTVPKPQEAAAGSSSSGPSSTSSSTNTTGSLPPHVVEMLSPSLDRKVLEPEALLEASLAMSEGRPRTAWQRPSRFQLWLQALQAAVAHAPVRSAVIASGLALEADIDRLQATAEALAAVLGRIPSKAELVVRQHFNPEHEGWTPSLLHKLGSRLHALGSILTGFIVTDACNDPSCRNLKGCSEQELVQGSGHACAGCRTARYCGRGCQYEHWGEHQKVCKEVAAARGKQVQVAAAGKAGS